MADSINNIALEVMNDKEYIKVEQQMTNENVDRQKRNKDEKSEDVEGGSISKRELRREALKKKSECVSWQPMTWVQFSFGSDEGESEDEDEDGERYYLIIYGALLLMYGFLYLFLIHFANRTYYTVILLDNVQQYKTRFRDTAIGFVLLAVLVLVMFFIKYTKMFPFNYICLILSIPITCKLWLGLATISISYTASLIFIYGVLLTLCAFEIWNGLIRVLEFNYIRWFILYPLGGIAVVIIIAWLPWLSVWSYEYSLLEKFLQPIIVLVLVFSFLVELQLIDYDMIDTRNNNFAITTTLLFTSYLNLPLYLIRIFRGSDDEE